MTLSDGFLGAEIVDNVHGEIPLVEELHVISI